MPFLSSPADAAFGRFVELVKRAELFRFDSPQLSEADTRAKFIDPIFRDVLGWSEAEIRRETPSAQGFSDYVLGSEFSYLVIEAKRTRPRFQLNVPVKARRLKLDGPHLLSGHKRIRQHIEQAHRYAIDCGAQFALVTNGNQIVIFRPYVPGRSWTAGIALVWHDHIDIQQNFAEFFNLLSRDRVLAGSLGEVFEELESVTTQLFLPLEFVGNPDRELIRNPFWQKISSVLGPLLSDDSAIRDEIITYCYVKSPLSDAADKDLDRLIRDTMPRFLEEAKVKDLQIGMGGKTAFDHALVEDVKRGRPVTYLLTGGVGSGKTTFLRRFAGVANPGFVREYCAWLHVDFLPLGNVSADALDSELQKFAYRELRRQLEAMHPSLFPRSGEEIRELFAEHVRKAEMTRLYGVERGSSEWNRLVNELVDDLFRDDSMLVSAVLARVSATHRRVVIALDNTDQLGDHFQEKVFLFSQRLADDCSALCIVALREERFFAAYRRGIFDAFGEKRFHLGSPDLSKVLFRRLQHGRRRLNEQLSSGALELSGTEREDIDKLLGVLIRSTTKRNAQIVRMLSCVSNGDMRHALDMFRDFISSGNTNINKILSIFDREGGYVVPFHEFAKSAILGSRRFFRGSVSHTLNLFKRTESRGASHAAAVRMLARLSSAEGVASPHGEGFVPVTKLLREYRQSFGFADDFTAWGDELLRRGLIESEPPKCAGFTLADAVRVNAAGSYYWKYLVRSFAYVDLVFVDTAIGDRDLARKLGHLAESIEMEDRFARARLFLAHLHRTEAQELAESSRRSGPYSDSLLEIISKQVENEIASISQKKR